MVNQRRALGLARRALSSKFFTLRSQQTTSSGRSAICFTTKRMTGALAISWPGMRFDVFLTVYHEAVVSHNFLCLKTGLRPREGISRHKRRLCDIRGQGDCRRPSRGQLGLKEAHWLCRPTKPGGHLLHELSAAGKNKPYLSTI